MFRGLIALDGRRRLPPSRSSGRSCRHRPRRISSRAVDPAAVVYYCVDDFAATSPGARRVSHERDRDVPACRSRVRHLGAAASARRRRSSRRARVPGRRRLRQVRGGAAVARTGCRPIWRRSRARSPATSARFISGSIRTSWRAWRSSCRDVTFAFVGPEQVDVTRLTSRPNVRLLGARPHDQSAGVRERLRVALVPYRRSDFTDSVYPVKLNEYLAMGVPVVATDLPEIRRFNERHGDVAGGGGRRRRVRRPRCGRRVADRQPDARASTAWRLPARTAGATRLEEMSDAHRIGDSTRVRRASADGNSGFAGSTRATQRGPIEIAARSCSSTAALPDAAHVVAGRAAQARRAAAEGGRHRRLRRRRRRIRRGRRRLSGTDQARGRLCTARDSRRGSCSRPGSCSRFARPNS